MNRAAGTAIETNTFIRTSVSDALSSMMTLLMLHILAFISYLYRITILAFLSLFRLLPTKPATTGPLKVLRQSSFITVCPFPLTSYKL